MTRNTLKPSTPLGLVSARGRFFVFVNHFVSVFSSWYTFCMEAYEKKDYDLLDGATPLVFADGTDVYGKLRDTYRTHDRGFFILAPSGAGKTHFIENQKEPHWIDGDDLWMAARAHPQGAWWEEDIAVIDEIDQKSDVVTVEAKKLGFWIMGASNYWLKPDAVVIPEWETHVAFIEKRERDGYDGGATIKDLEKLRKSREWMMRWEREGVSIFQSIEEAANSLTEIN